MQRAQAYIEENDNYILNQTQRNEDYYPYSFEQTDEYLRQSFKNSQSLPNENSPKYRRTTSQNVSHREIPDIYSPIKRLDTSYKGKIFTDDFNQEFRRSTMITLQENLKRSTRLGIPIENPQNGRELSPKKRKIFSPTSKYQKFKINNQSQVFYESPTRHIKSVVSKSSKSIMKKVFDEEDSPNRKNDQEKSLINLNPADVSSSSNFLTQIANDQTNNVSKTSNSFQVDLGYLEMCQKAYLQTVISESETIPESFDEQLDFSLKVFADPNKQIRIGAMLTVFELIHKNDKIITSEHISNILRQLYQLILDYHYSDDVYMEIFSLEIISIIGPHQISFNNISILLDIVSDETRPIIQEKAFQTLFHLDYPGLNGLVDIAKGDIITLSLFVLNKLAQCTEIQTKIIIPSLVNELSALDSKKKIGALAALNRFFSLIHQGNALPSLIALLQDGTLDRHIAASVIYSAGSIGEQTLIKLLKSSPNAKIREAICYALAWRMTKYSNIKLNLNVVHYQVAQHGQLNPGAMCTYKGNLKSLAQIDVYDEEPNQEANDTLEINSRDLIAALNRLLTLKYQQFNSENKINVEIPSLNRSPAYGCYEILKFFTKDQEKINSDTGKVPSTVIKILISASSDKDPTVRESAVKSLGYIGLPEANESIDTLVKCLYDTDSQIRATAAWSIGRLGELCCSKASKRLIELLRDNFWKVRTAACVALGFMGENIDPKPNQILLKILKEGTVNKLTVCETLVRLGVQGELELLELLRALPGTNYVMKTAIIQSFELANVNLSSIDFIIEELFRNAGDPMIQVRKACLNTLEHLRAKAQMTSITYLKPRNILPLFYYFLQDRSAELRNLAINSICSFGSQGELLFIEGLANDPNPEVRSQCAKGLGSYGICTFRGLILGLRDHDETVRNTTGTILLKKFKAKDVINEFKDKHHQKSGLIISLKELLNKENSHSTEVKKLLEELLVYFENDIKLRSQENLTTFGLSS